MHLEMASLDLSISEQKWNARAKGEEPTAEERIEIYSFIEVEFANIGIYTMMKELLSCGREKISSFRHRQQHASTGPRARR